MFLKFSRKEIVVFLAGAETFHTLTHLLIKFSDTLPITFFGMEWTQQNNMYAIIINGLIAVGLLWYASKLKK